MTDASPADAAPGNWVDRFAPVKLRPWLRLMRADRPVGVWLLLWPCWWALALAAPRWPDAWLLALFALGAFIMRGAGCVLNDIADRDFDAQVARTRNRPIPAGLVSVKQAAMFMAGLCLAGLLVLLQLNGFSVALGAASLLVVAIYPFAKRVTDYPQLVLGLAFNWGALLGWAAVRGTLDWPALALYIGGICWTVGYDTIYAHMDKDDDIQIGVRSTALKFGAQTENYLFRFYIGALGGIAAAGTLAGLGNGFLLGLIPAAIHLAWQVNTLEIENPKNCLYRFKSNHLFGALVFAAILMGKL